jgi:hypothetical protein
MLGIVILNKWRAVLRMSGWPSMTWGFLTSAISLRRSSAL